jgi:D-glycero-alpha-D-manno-heptose-7-phosphate kinase
VAANADTTIYIADDVPTPRIADDPKEECVVVAVAPLRIDLTGGFTDIPPFSSSVDSLHINAAFDLTVTVRCQMLRNRGVWVGFSRDDNPASTGRSEGRRRFLDAVRAGVAEFADGSGLDLRIHSDAPAGSGLGSSGAILVAAIGGCARLTGVTLTEAALARKAITAAAVGGIVGGQQDEFAAAHGSVRAYVFDRSGATEIQDFASTDVCRNLEESLLVAQMGAGGRKADVVADVVRAVRSSDRETIGALLYLQELAHDLREIMIRGRLEVLPRCLRRIREAQYALHPRMCCPNAASAIEAVREKIPELEYKMLGGGGVGSCVLLHVPARLKTTAMSLLRGRAKRVLAVRIQPSGMAAEFAKEDGFAAHRS